MDHIISQLDKKIIFFDSFKMNRDSVEYYRVKIEYALFFVLSYLWNKNINKLSADVKGYVYDKINSPSIGSVIDVARMIDVNKEVFNNKRFNEVINRYPALRNDKVGHGYVFDDGLLDYYDSIKKLADQLFSVCPILGDEYDLIYVMKGDDSKYIGISYKSNGVDFAPWGCPKEVKEFSVGEVYAFGRKGYIRVSPFIYFNENSDFFIFRNIDERLNGKVKYNQLFRAGSFFKEWDELSNVSLEVSSYRRMSVNGTIMSVINKNYKRYIDIRIVKNRVLSFLLKDKASVCATIWGHGGVGKTAIVQSICDDLANDRDKKFDYIVFASAKDRYYNYYTGAIEVSEDNINTFDALMKSINRVMFDEESCDERKIVCTDNKVLIIIDDYETFPSEEKLKIEDFIRGLNINYHKVLVTTRANLIIGDEFQTNEFDLHETSQFLCEILKYEFEGCNISLYEKDLDDADNSKMIHEITGGRPLFVYQFAYLWMQIGVIKKALERSIRSDLSAMEFLYGRIYDYLSSAAKDVFVAMGQIVLDQDDMTNLLEKVRYVINKENDLAFEPAIRELEKLRIIEIIEGRFFKIYSKEILPIMLSFFDRRGESFRKLISRRIKEVTRDKKMDNERAFLFNANAARTSRSEEEVIRLYRSILNRETSPIDVKIQAILNLGEYLYNNRGKKDEAIKHFRDYEHIFMNEPNYIKMYASYCWSMSRQKEAVDMLLEYFAKKQKTNNEDKNQKYELLGLLLMYRGISAIQDREDLKEKYRFGDIDYLIYKDQYDTQKKVFIDICDHQGRLLFNSIKKDYDISFMTSAARQNIASGLYQYVNLCIRINRYREASEVCQYVIKVYPTHFSEQFKFKYLFCKRKLSYDIES